MKTRSNSTDVTRSKQPAESAKRSHQPAMDVRSNRAVQSLLEPAARSSGKPLEPGVRTEMERGFGHSLGDVRVHTDGAASAAARSGGVEAFTSGSDVVFRPGRYQPETMRGRNLLAHELTHVVQQSKGSGGRRVDEGGRGRAEAEADTAARDVVRGRTPRITAGGGVPAVQFKIVPEDLNSEMAGLTFELTKPFVASMPLPVGGAVPLAQGDQVKVITWGGAPHFQVQANVLTGKSKGSIAVLPQTVIRAVSSATAGVAQYSAEVGTQVAAVEKNEAAVAAAKTPDEKTRLEGLLTKRRAVLNRKQIQQAMFNRFDAVIDREVRAANAAHSLTGADALDPNLLKSQLFQESQMGTSGEHLEEPPSHPVKTRFNLGQVIDSSALALLTLFEKEQPAVITKFSLQNMRADLRTAQNRHAALLKKSKDKKTPLTALETTELSTLTTLAKKNWETFMWLYKPAGKTQGFREAVDDFFASSATPKNVDYEFWIHLAVFWVFEKKTKGRTWADAIKAYNGGGQAAEDYKKAVIKRAADAAAAKAGTFVPDNI